MIEFLRKIIRNKIIVLSICIILICAVYFIARKIIDNYESEVFDLESEEILEDLTNADTEIAEEDIVNDVEMNDEVEEDNDVTVTEIFVHVAGEVNNPGVVTLNEGTRIIDAINAAGGITPNADISDINLAYVLKDGMKINIPNKEDVQEKSDFAYVTDSYEKDNKEASDSEIEQEKEEEQDEVLSVNINTATQTELESLPGIGPSLALKIVNYRKEHGKFSSIDELKNVSGIGEAKFEALKDFVVVF